jgi:hypothetical protein
MDVRNSRPTCWCWQLDDDEGVSADLELVSLCKLMSIPREARCMCHGWQIRMATVPHRHAVRTTRAGCSACIKLAVMQRTAAPHVRNDTFSRVMHTRCPWYTAGDCCSECMPTSGVQGRLVVARARRARPSRRSTACATWRPATCCGRRWRRRPRSARRQAACRGCAMPPHVNTSMRAQSHKAKEVQQQKPPRGTPVCASPERRASGVPSGRSASPPQIAAGAGQRQRPWPS